MEKSTMNKRIVITSWYFNPLHPGHVECFERCKTLGDELRVIVNNDYQAQQKTWSQELFQDQDYRMTIVAALKSVDHVMLSIDHDVSVCASIEKIATLIRSTHWPQTQIIFGKWGDRTSANIPELPICKQLSITIIDGLWAKIDNSSIYRAKGV
jgi:cytidyltransferase-like protein